MPVNHCSNARYYSGVLWDIINVILQASNILKYQYNQILRYIPTPLTVSRWNQSKIIRNETRNIIFTKMVVSGVCVIYIFCGWIVHMLEGCLWWNVSLDETDRIAQFSAGWWRESQPIINIQECDHCGWTDLGLPLQRKLACRHLQSQVVRMMRSLVWTRNILAVIITLITSYSHLGNSKTRHLLDDK